VEKASSTATFEPAPAGPGTDVVLRVDHLGKKYSHTPAAARRPGLRKLLRAMAGLQEPPKPPALDKEEFWAVHDVSFTLRRGEALGIVGLNGAGKSTLLKIILGRLRPDVGEVEVFGGSGGLIELGAGFHPEMTGRENISTNATLLGAKPADIERLTPEIIAFADIGVFIDSPVKQYSSGMKVRLGFAIAVHFVPDLVVCDEIMAVGDFDFRQKCFNRMNELRRDRSFILVSHGARNILNFCDRAILMHRGELISDGPPGRVLEEFGLCQRHFSPEHLRALLAHRRTSLTGHGDFPVLPDGLDDGDDATEAADQPDAPARETAPTLVPDPVLVSSAQDAPLVEAGWHRLNGATFNDRGWSGETLNSQFGPQVDPQPAITGLAVDWNLRREGRAFVHTHGQPWRVRLWLRLGRAAAKISIGFPIFDETGRMLLGPLWEQGATPLPAGAWAGLDLSSQPFPLLMGNYYLILTVSEGPAFLWRRRLGRFTVRDPFDRSWQAHGEYAWHTFQNSAPSAETH